MIFTLRYADLSDAARFAEVNYHSWQSTYRGLVADSTLQALSPESYLEKWKHNLSGENTERVCLAAVVDGEIVGYATCGKSRHAEYPQFEWELFALYLLEEYQGNE